MGLAKEQRNVCLPSLLFPGIAQRGMFSFRTFKFDVTVDCPLRLTGRQVKGEAGVWEACEDERC